MCNDCKRNNLSPEFESILHNFETEDEYGSQRIAALSHPSLGHGKIFPRQGEVQQYESGTGAYHPSLGKGKIISKSGEINSELEVIGIDERVNVINTKDVPFRWICHLNLLFPDPDNSSNYIGFGGSGTLISPHHILTAGHCVFSNVTGSNGTSANLQVSKVIATPGSISSGSGPFGSASGTKVQYTSLWRSTQNPRYDFGLITLSQDIGSKPMSALGGKPLGFWGSSSYGSGTRINPKDRNTLLNATVNISGYPGDKPDGTPWRAVGKIINIMPAAGSELIYYDVDTCPGHSGAPVWIRYEDFRNMVAIHTGACLIGPDCSYLSGTYCTTTRQRRTSNRGILITPSLMSQVQQWMNS
jgi:V8-like Glu-specific endopeptidase